MGDPIGDHGRTGPGFGPPSTGLLDSTSSKAACDDSFSSGNDLEYDALIHRVRNIPESDMTDVRKAYDEFLLRFPLRHDVWIEYANHKCCNDKDKAKEVYDRAIESVPYSPLIWCSCCEFLISSDESPDIIRGYFQKGLAKIGTNYDSNILWDMWIKFETDHQEWNNLAMIYVRILEHPIKDLNFYHTCLNALVRAHLSEINMDLNLADVTATFEKAKELGEKINCFELSMATRCFSSNALTNSEIKNWHCYLDFMENQCTVDQVCKLYERCLIACAQYSEFWKRYVMYLCDHGDIGLANAALRRAITICVKEHETLHMFNAHIQEFYGDVFEARNEYERLCSYPTVVVDATIKLANLERRLQGKEQACKVYERVIAKEKRKEQKQSHILASLQLAYGRFLLSASDIRKTRVLLDDVLSRGHLTREHIEDVINLESQIPGKKSVDSVVAAVEKFLKEDITQDLSEINAKENISLTFITFLQRFGDAHHRKKAHHEHARLFSCKEARHLGLQKRKFMEDVGGGHPKRINKEAQQAPKDCQSQVAKDDQRESSKAKTTVAGAAKKSLSLSLISSGYGSDSDY